MARMLKVLFLCTGNACRSQMGEAILRHIGKDRFEPYSAGVEPAGFVHPLAIETMRRMNVPMDDPRSKSWDEFADTKMDVVVTVCDHAAAQSCPVWPGDPIRVQWSLPDPANRPGSDEERLAFAARVARRLRTKIEGLVALDWSQDRATLTDRLEFLGEI